MKTLLIVFAVLLLLLTLLSTFGGSIRPSEPFIQEIKPRNEYYYDTPNVSEQFEDPSVNLPAMPQMSEQFEHAPYMSEHYKNLAPPGLERFEEDPAKIPEYSAPMEYFTEKPKVPSFESFDESPLMPSADSAPKAHFVDGPATNLTMSSKNSMPPMTGGSAGGPPMNEGFMIEPFEEDKKVSFYASF